MLIRYMSLDPQHRTSVVAVGLDEQGERNFYLYGTPVPIFLQPDDLPKNLGRVNGSIFVPLRSVQNLPLKYRISGYGENTSGWRKHQF